LEIRKDLFPKVLKPPEGPPVGPPEAYNKKDYIMSATTYLFIANAAVWIGVAGYLIFLAGKSAGLEKRVQQLELLGDHNDG